ncbi:hypothetical protein BIY24_12010 [Halobacteriovorax marinus]|uniref:Uncharacterized protein n=1 Tax=Halobacteriovorax marinus (strain ATCC BAA-682 / DSM 15412 / SJ) TaxID=862908 RepID=E1X5Z8_HALMS|nr:hypothetical protein [Halobacteriovorax marinus]ATH08644.1 hypothetical protein BIY24_12010 [Halobacteriovorax marinus]CBW27342.1 hypothetical protein BMS_2553 [Halobacteriovorax marinus SJ]
MKTIDQDNSQAKNPSLYSPTQVSLDIMNLEILISKLKGICHEIDPYTELTLSMKERLIDVGIEEFNDPFALTNQLLFMTENAIEELAKLKEEN